MDMINTIVETAIVGLTTKFIDFIDDKIKSLTKDVKEVERELDDDFRVSFQEYLRRSYDKYSKIKTLLYRNEPQYIYDFFEVPYLSKKEESEFKTYEEDGFKVDNISDILSISEFVIIKGTGGIGKSTLMKHLFINTLEQGQDIPVFLELKDLNSVENSTDMEEIILSRIRDLGCDLEKKYLLYALDGVRFLFLLDGYDELSAEKKDWFFSEVNAFCDRYPKNRYIISSRECSNFVEFQRFSVLRVLPLNKEQALSLISKLDGKIKENFIVELENGLYEEYQFFFSNPLLLNIMLRTYDNYAEIPGKIHEFYSKAFDTLYSEHDASKGAYKREFRRGLSREDFQEVLARFSYRTYVRGESEFSYNQLQDHLKKVIKGQGYSFSIEDYIEDLINGVCVLYRDGLNYRFTHRSFQEYFTAVFLSSLEDEKMEKESKDLILKDIKKSIFDDVFYMLYGMNERQFEKNILLPIIDEFEKDLIGNRYDYYLKNYFVGVSFDQMPNKNMRGDSDSLIKYRLIPDYNNIMDSLMFFLMGCVEYHANSNEWKTSIKECNEPVTCDEIVSYLKNTRSYKVGDAIGIEDIIEDMTLYNYIKRTKLGVDVSVLSDLKNRIEEKHRR